MRTVTGPEAGLFPAGETLKLLPANQDSHILSQKSRERRRITAPAFKHSFVFNYSETPSDCTISTDPDSPSRPATAAEAQDYA